MPASSGPAQIEITPVGGGSTTIITREDQLEDAMMSIERLNFEHRTQESGAPIDYRKTGINAGLAVSIADVERFPLIGLAFGADVIVDGTKRKIELSDDAGLEFAKFSLVVKPYAGALPTTDQNQWWTFLNAVAVSPDAFEMAFGLETQRQFNLRFMALPDPSTRVKVIIGDQTAS